MDLADKHYLLSPQDLAAYDLLPQLVAEGVAAFKIEGRLKAPEYVASITRHYRKALDEAWEGRPVPLSRAEVDEMAMTFSRGFSHGFLDGNNHKTLVRADYAKKRGIFLGTVAAVSGQRVRVDLAAPIKPGDGVVFDGNESAALPEQGGRVYEVFEPGRGRRPGTPRPEGIATGLAELGFGRNDLDPHALRPGQRVWKTDDPVITRRIRASFEGPPRRQVEIDLAVRAVAGAPLTVEGRTATGSRAIVCADTPLAAATQHPATADDLRAQLDRLGGTLYQLRGFEAVVRARRWSRGAS